MRISDWSSDVCSSDLVNRRGKCPWLRGFLRLDSKLFDRAVVSQSRNHLISFLRELAEPGLFPRPEGLSSLHQQPFEIGRASCRERVCQYVSISVVAVSLKKTKKKENIINKKI